MRAMLSKRILLVEDQEQAAQMLQAGLQSLDSNFTVITVGSAEDALKQLALAAFDLLISDVMLPGISGLELMSRFRRRNPLTKVILLSGVRDPEIRKQAARSGTEAFFFKPVEIADLLDAVERLLGMAQSFLPSEMSVVTSDGPSEKVAQQLAELRFNLQANSVALVNQRGQIEARAGALPDEQIETTLMPHLMSAFTAFGRISAFAKAEHPDDLLTVRGADYHLHLASVSPSHFLLVITKELKAARLAALAEAMQKTATRMANALSPVPAPAPSRPRVEPDLADTDPHLERLLDLAETKPSSPRAVEKYWKTAELPPLPVAGALSYEQAAQLGLAPSQD
jgi:DNA-binding response OmpR family regulator